MGNSEGNGSKEKYQKIFQKILKNRNFIDFKIIWGKIVCSLG